MEEHNIFSLIADNLSQFYEYTGFANATFGHILMILIGLAFVYLAIKKEWEPMLLVPIGFGIIIGNIPLFPGLSVGVYEEGSVLNILYQGVQQGYYPPLIFLGIGAMTDFSALISNPKLMLIGAAAQFGIFGAYGIALALGFTPAEAGAIGIIGGADGPTAIFLSSRLAPDLVGAIAVSAYSYMALVPVIQPPIMRLLTTKKERLIKMKSPRAVSKKEKLIFPVVVTLIVGILLPDALPLLGMLMLGNFMKESLCVERLVKTASNELMNIVTIFLGLIVGTKAVGSTFLSAQTLGIIAMGLLAFIFGTIGGVLTAQVINLFSKKKINPLIGSAGVSAVPMAARVSQKVGQEECPDNYLLMHAMGPNVAGVIGSAVAAGVFLALFA